MTRTLLAAALLAALAAPLPAADTLIVPIPAVGGIDDGKPKGAPNPAGNNDLSDPAQSKFKEIADADGWASTDEEQLPQPAKPGTPATLLGVKITGEKIVYVVDHSAGVAPFYDDLATALNTSILRLSSSNSFALIAVAEKIDTQYPKKDFSDTKTVSRRLALGYISTMNAGVPGKTAEAFPAAVAEAFARKPDAICLVGGSALDPKLADKIKELNPDKKIKISTVALGKVPAETEKLLKSIAETYGGEFKSVQEKDLKEFSGSVGDLNNFTGGSVGKGSGGTGVGEGGKLAKYGGAGGGSGPGPFGLFGVALLQVNRVVYIIDHSGSTIDTFDFLREETKANIYRLTPAHKFSVLMVGEKTDAVFPADKIPASATPEVKRELKNFMDGIRASGKNEDLFEPFADAFTQAFKQKAQAICFLVDGNIDPKLADKIKELNKDGKVKINTIAFIKVSKETEELLQKIAADNGGKFKYVTEKDLGK